MSGSGATCPSLIRQMNPRREPMQSRIEARDQHKIKHAEELV